MRLKALLGALVPINVSGPMYLRQQLDQLGVPRIALSQEVIKEVAHEATAKHKSICEIFKRNWREGVTEWLDLHAIAMVHILMPTHYPPPLGFSPADLENSIGAAIKRVYRRHGIIFPDENAASAPPN